MGTRFCLFVAFPPCFKDVNLHISKHRKPYARGVEREKRFYVAFGLFSERK